MLIIVLNDLLLSDAELVQSVCVFGKSNQQPTWKNTSNGPSKFEKPWRKNFRDRERCSQEEYLLSSEPICSPRAKAEGDAFTIDEDFSSDSELPPV